MIDDEVDTWGDTAPPGPGRVVPAGPEPLGPVDMTTRYLGLKLRSPVVASASPLTGDVDALAAMDDAGVGAVVLPSLFEEQIEHEADQLARFVALDSGAHAEAPGGYAPGLLDGYNEGASRYLQLVRDAKRAVGVPVIASLNGVTPGGWVRYATMVADAGADAIELNVYRIAADPGTPGSRVERDLVDLVASVAEASSVPVAVKLGPYYSALGHLAGVLVDAGAAGLVLFNRFYQPDIALASLSIEQRLSLSSPDELRLPLRWCALLHGRLDASLAATTGVHDGEDVVKVLLAGADVAMTTSALLRHGPRHVRTMVDSAASWFTEHGYGSVTDAVGAVSQQRVADPSAYERANYLEALTSFASRFTY